MADSPPCLDGIWNRRTDRLVVLLGRDGDQFFDDVWELDLDQRTWHPVVVAVQG